jgi:predicted NAD/FAD-binding protein
MRKIAVIGAGWAGLTAALNLQARGYHITLYERSPKLLGIGGRASTAYRAGDKAPFAIDNGQHVLLTAYSETLALLKAVNLDVDTAFLRLPANWYMPDLLHIKLPSWGDAVRPNHLWATGFLKQIPLLIAMLNASVNNNQPTLIEQYSRLKAAIRLLIDSPKPQETVQQWLIRLNFPASFNTALWQPLCYATLNTPPNIASAFIFKQVIKDGLLAGSYQAAMLVPRNDLGATLPDLALKKLSSKGAILQLGTAVESVVIDDNTNDNVNNNINNINNINDNTDKKRSKLSIYTRDSSVQFDGVVCATTAKDAVRLLPIHCISDALNQAAVQATEPITTIHLKLNVAHHDTQHLLTSAVLIMPDADRLDAKVSSIQNAVILDRSYLVAEHLGWLTLVLSSSHMAIKQSKSDLVNAAINRLVQVFPCLSQATIVDSVVIHAKQATFSCTTTLVRPSTQTAHPTIVLAGDYIYNANALYPATLEGAVRNGHLAANHLHTIFNFLHT